MTEKPTGRPVKTVRDLAAYRDAAWLLKRHSVSVLPSVASLKPLRVLARKDVASPKPLSADEIHHFLGPDEALLLFAVDKSESYVFALTADAFDWKWRASSACRKAISISGATQATVT